MSKVSVSTTFLINIWIFLNIFVSLLNGKKCSFSIAPSFKYKKSSVIFRCKRHQNVTDYNFEKLCKTSRVLPNWENMSSFPIINIPKKIVFVHANQGKNKWSANTSSSPCIDCSCTFPTRMYGLMKLHQKVAETITFGKLYLIP